MWSGAFSAALFASAGLTGKPGVSRLQLAQKWRRPMPKILECAKVDPSSGCQHVVRGETEEELMRNVGEHAREHGIREVTPELMERVKANIRDA
jgi:predicted small metal-binding protein